MPSKRYYTAREAMQKLGMAKSTFYYFVEKGRIQKHLPPHRERGAYFLASDIDEMAAALQGFLEQYSEERDKTIFRTARPEDAPEMYELGRKVMEPGGGHGVRPELLLPYLSMPNSEIGHVLIRDHKIVGYFTILPLKHDILMRRMRREIYTADIKPDELAQFEPGEPIDCFIWELLADPDYKQLGVLLIGKMLTFFHTLGKRGVEIEGIYATVTSREGIELSRKMGMHPMNFPEVIRPNWIPFELKIQEEPKNRLIRNYIQALKSYKRRHQGEART